MTIDAEVAVIGAGPHGLATSAFLRSVGVHVRTFGDTFSFWRDHMPAGMLLRSAPRSSHIADPDGALTLDAWAAAAGRRVARPVPLSDYLEYGYWYQREAVPDVDPRHVANVAANNGHYRLSLEDGETLETRHVVVAAGIKEFPRVPRGFERLDAGLVSHSSSHTSFSEFAGRQVTVLGCGQSALESAALLSEAGADVEVIARAAQPHFIASGKRSRRRRRLWRAAPTDIGGRATSWLSAAPSFWRWLPRQVRPGISFRCIRPAGARWLPDRLQSVRMTCSSAIESVRADEGRVCITLTDGSERTSDHLLLATGYEIDVTRYPFLDRRLIERVRTVSGYPVLGRGLESTAPGVHFVGAPAAYSFGPVMRFVVGSWYDAPAVAARISGRRSIRRVWAFAPREVLAQPSGAAP